MKDFLASVLLSIIFITSICYVYPSSTFVVSLQKSGGWSLDEWVELEPPKEPLAEFTACHWEKLRYFSTEIMSVWAYCIANKNEMNNINCTQFYTTGNHTTMNQQVLLLSWINGGPIEYHVNLEKYRHRTWNHMCWSYSIVSKENKYYYNGDFIGKRMIKNLPTPIPAADESFITSFILGQEPDSLKGEFSTGQLFNGELSEVNIWNSVLNDDQILALGNCKSNEKGNVVAWDRNSIKNHGAFIEESFDTNIFCRKEETFVVLPRRLPLSIAKRVCISHGGLLATPRSEQENRHIMDLLSLHKDTCMEENPTNPANSGIAAWLGLSREKGYWYTVNNEGQQISLSFSNWGNKPPSDYDTDCSYVKSDGKWSYQSPESCDYLELCMVCHIEGHPVLSINGICYDSEFDFNYYLVVDNKSTISYYQGYKSSKIVNENNMWRFVLNRGNTNAKIDYELGNAKGFPVGRHEWSSYEPKCKIRKKEVRELSMSTCSFGTQFTCDSGFCIELYKRCNQIKDCEDESDENDCKLIQLPNSYREVQPPEPLNSSEPLNIVTYVKIVSIDSIDTINMRVGLTMTINMKWKDSRLTFANLIPDSQNKVTQETVEKIWTPLQYVTHDNALIGEIYPDQKKEVEVQFCPSNSMLADYMTKLLFAEQFMKMRKLIMNLVNKIS